MAYFYRYKNLFKDTGSVMNEPRYSMGYKEYSRSAFEARVKYNLGITITDQTVEDEWITPRGKYYRVKI